MKTTSRRRRRKLVKYLAPLPVLAAVAAAGFYLLHWAEPAPVHVPRQRPPLVVIDDGALELVETRQDLSRVELPNVHSDEAPAPRA